MIIERTDDIELIKLVAFDPVVWQTISEDGFGQSDYEVDLGHCWLTAKDEQVIGVYNLHPINAITLQIHPMILPQFRGKQASQSARAVLHWVIDNTDYDKVFCYVPVIYRHVILFAMQSGMVKEGINRRSWLKNGKIHDMVMLGITRQEIEALT